jgi:phosphate transport system substrate-binding protein
MAVDLARDTTEPGSYPVILLSYLIACETYADADQAELVKEYLTYAISPEGQDAAAGEAGSAPLDSGLQDEALGIIANISAG